MGEGAVSLAQRKAEKRTVDGLPFGQDGMKEMRTKSGKRIEMGWSWIVQRALHEGSKFS